MRARNIKSSLFKNEVLGTADPLHTIVFEGLWCEADREGRLEDRPLRLKAEIIPYREGVDINVSLNWLTENGFIARYDMGGIKVIQVLKFSEHQRPHANEVASVLPSLEQSTSNQGKKSVKPRNKALRSDSLILIPDSGSLIPDPLSLLAGKTPPSWFEEFRQVYPKRAGDQQWRKAISAGLARITEGHQPTEFIAGAARYAVFIQATGKADTEYVQQAARFLGPGKPFLLPWNPPAVAESATDEIKRLNGGSHASTGRVFEAEPSRTDLVPLFGNVRR